jgi:hypothetical protein
MIRFLLRALSLLVLAIAFFFVIYDGVEFIVNQRLKPIKVDAAWAMVNQNSLNQTEQWLSQHVPWFWDPFGQTLFDQPIWLVLGVLAVVLMLLGRKKKKLIGYARD